MPLNVKSVLSVDVRSEVASDNRNAKLTSLLLNLEARVHRRKGV